MILSPYHYRPAKALFLSIVVLSLIYLFSNLDSRRGLYTTSNDEEHPTVQRKNALAVASLKGDDISWLETILPEWEKNIYVVDDANATLSVAKNKGRESMVYLT